MIPGASSLFSPFFPNSYTSSLRHTAAAALRGVSCRLARLAVADSRSRTSDPAALPYPYRNHLRTVYPSHHRRSLPPAALHRRFNHRRCSLHAPLASLSQEQGRPPEHHFRHRPKAAASFAARRRFPSFDLALPLLATQGREDPRPPPPRRQEPPNVPPEVRQNAGSPCSRRPRRLSSNPHLCLAAPPPSSRWRHLRPQPEKRRHSISRSSPSASLTALASVSPLLPRRS